MSAANASSSSSSAAAGPSSTSNARPAPAEITTEYNRFKNELQGLAKKIGELEQDVEEHQLVLSTVQPLVATDPDRKCWRLIGGILVEKTVKEMTPLLKTNTDGIESTLGMLVKQYKNKETEFSQFQKKHNIQVSSHAAVE